jgi:MFS family permease
MLWLVLARGVQGIGAGMLQATAFTSVSDMFPQPARRARWQGLITSTFGIASVVGPVLGGVMTETLGWRSVFYINLPVGILAFSLIRFTLPADLSPRTPQARIDWAGAATITLAISALLLAVEWGGNTLLWTSPAMLGLGAVFLAALIGFGVIELRAPEPLLPLDLFRQQTILLTNGISLLLGFVLFALVYYTPLLLQGGLGLSPSAAGALQTPLAVSTALGSLISGQIFGRTQRMKALLITGALMMLAGSLPLLWVQLGSSPFWLSGWLALAGVGAGFQFPMLTLLVQSIVPRWRLGVATSTVQFLRLIGSTVGTAIIASTVTAVFAGQMQAAMPPGTGPQVAALFHNPQALVDPDAQAKLQQGISQAGPAAADEIRQLTEVAHSALIAGVRLGYVMAAILAVAALALILWLRTPNYRGGVRKPPSQEAAADIV